MPEIILDGKKIEYDVRKSSRASRSRIDVDLSGVTVVIPEEKNLEPADFLKEKKDWVLDKNREMEEYWARVPERDLKDGEKFPYLGEDKTIEISKNGRFDVEGGKILIPNEKISNSSVKDEIEKLYREKAREKIQEIIDIHERKIEGGYNKIYIRNQKTKWASCSSKNNLSFNWRLMMAPEKVLEYVVVHELLHLDEPNHSDRFWRLMEKILPDYRDRRTWLKENSPELVFSEEDLL